MIQMVSLTDRFLGVCEKIAMLIANGLLASMLLIGLGNLLIREVLGKGIIWIFPWTMVLFVWLVFIGYFIVVRRQADVTLEVLVAMTGPVGRTFCRWLYAFCAVTLNAVIIFQLPRILKLKRDTVEIVGIPDYAVTMPLFISAILVMLCAFVQLFRPDEFSDSSVTRG